MRYLSKKLRHLKCNGSSEGKFYASYTVTKARSDGIKDWKNGSSRPRIIVCKLHCYKSTITT
ncbi:hypothetical protein NC651_013058 [Populus alba x Populus x berolinensis]|nr:hypothetical protein NC651_013058 [Populus alba x Populus x berolinensis]